MAMRLFVCVKRVPKSKTNIEVPQRGFIDVAGLTREDVQGLLISSVDLAKEDAQR